MTTEQERNCLKHQHMNEPTAALGTSGGNRRAKIRSNEEVGRKRRFLKDKKVRWSPLQPTEWTNDATDEVFFNSAALEVEQETTTGSTQCRTPSGIREPLSHFEHFGRHTQVSVAGVHAQQGYTAPSGQLQTYPNVFNESKEAHVNEPFYQKIHSFPQKTQKSIGSKDQQTAYAEKQSQSRTFSINKFCPTSPTAAPHLPSPQKDINASPGTPDEGYSTGTNSTTSISSPLSASLASISVFDYNSPHHTPVHDNTLNPNYHYPNVPSTHPFNICQSQFKQYQSTVPPYQIDPAVSPQPYLDYVLKNTRGAVGNPYLRVQHREQSNKTSHIIAASPIRNYCSGFGPNNTSRGHQQPPVRRPQSSIQPTASPIMPHGPIKKGPSLHSQSRRSGSTTGSAPVLVGVKRRDTNAAAKRDINANNNNIDSFRNSNNSTNTSNNVGNSSEQQVSSIEDRLRALTTIEEEELNVNSHLQNDNTNGNAVNRPMQHYQVRGPYNENDTVFSEDNYPEPKQSQKIEHGGFTNQNNWSQDHEIEATGFFRAVPVQISHSDLSPLSPGRSPSGEILFQHSNYLHQGREFDENATFSKSHEAQNHVGGSESNNSMNPAIFPKPPEYLLAAEETIPKNAGELCEPGEFPMPTEPSMHNDFIARMHDRSGLKDYETYFQKEIDIPVHNLDLSKQTKFANTDRDGSLDTNSNGQFQSRDTSDSLGGRTTNHHTHLMQSVENIDGRDGTLLRTSNSKTRYSISREDDRLVLVATQDEFSNGSNGAVQDSQHDGYCESSLGSSRNTEGSIQKMYPNQNPQSGLVAGSMPDLRMQQHQLGRSQKLLDGSAGQYNSSLDIPEQNNAMSQLMHAVSPNLTAEQRLDAILRNPHQNPHHSAESGPLSARERSSHIDRPEHEGQAVLRRSNHRYSWNPSNLGNLSRDTRQSQRSSLDLASLPHLQLQIRATSELCLQASRRHVFASSADIYKLFSGGQSKRKPNLPIESSSPHCPQPSPENSNSDTQPRHLQGSDLNRKHPTNLRHSFHAPSNIKPLYAKLGSDQDVHRFSASLPLHGDFQNQCPPHQQGISHIDHNSHHYRQDNQQQLPATNFHPQQGNQEVYSAYHPIDITSSGGPVKGDHSIAVPQFQPKYSFPGYHPSSVNQPASDNSSLDSTFQHGSEQYLPTSVDHNAVSGLVAYNSATTGSNYNMDINDLRSTLVRQSSGYSSESELQQIESDAQAVKRHVLSHKRKIWDGKTHKGRPHPLAEAPNPNHEFVALNTSADHDSTTTAGTEDTNNIEDNNAAESIFYRRQTASAEPVYANQIMFGRGGDLTSRKTTKSGLDGAEDPPPPPLPARRHRPASVATESFNMYLPTQMAQSNFPQTAPVEVTDFLKDSSAPVHHRLFEAPLFFEGNSVVSPHDPKHVSMLQNAGTRTLQPTATSPYGYDSQFAHQFYQQQNYEPPDNIDYSEFIAGTNGVTDQSHSMSDTLAPPSIQTQPRGSPGFTQNQIINIQRRPVTITSHVPTNLFRNTSENTSQQQHLDRTSTLVAGLPDQDSSPKSPVEIAQLLEVPFATNIISCEQGDRLSTLV